MTACVQSYSLAVLTPVSRSHLLAYPPSFSPADCSKWFEQGSSPSRRCATVKKGPQAAHCLACSNSCPIMSSLRSSSGRSVLGVTYTLPHVVPPLLKYAQPA